MVKTKLSNSMQDEIVNRITVNFDVQRLILFGSYANGNPDENSDIDLLVILHKGGVAQKYGEKIRRRVEIATVLLEIIKRIPIDLLVYTRDEWSLLAASENSFVLDIQKNGIVLA